MEVRESEMMRKGIALKGGSRGPETLAEVTREALAGCQKRPGISARL